MFFLRNRDISSFSQPYTYNSGIATASVASIFDTMSDHPFMSPPATQTGAVSSLLSVLTADGKTSLRTTLATSTIASASSGNTTPASTATSGSTSGSTSIPNSNSAASSGGAAAASGSAASNDSSTTASASEATAVSKAATVGGMSSGTQAAIAVPVVIVFLAAIILALFCLRRRKRKRQEAGEAAEKVPLASRKKKWTRHLRIFSFDTELLMGGRYSSTNSMRSRQTGSMRSGTPSQNSQAASLHSVEEVAPPYRDAVSSAQPPSIGQVMAGDAVAAGGMSRSASNATAPPPYGLGAVSKANKQQPTSPASTLGPRNPFDDSAPVSPVDNSPFNDPPGNSPAISRNSSLYHNDRDEVSTIGGASDAASIREATLARNASVLSGGRVINNVSKN